MWGAKGTLHSARGWSQRRANSHLLAPADLLCKACLGSGASLGEYHSTKSAMTAGDLGTRSWKLIVTNIYGSDIEIEW